MMMNLMTVLVKKVFISSKPSIVCLLCPPPCGPFSIQESAVGGLSYKVKKNVPWHILAPRRGCFGNHLPLYRVLIRTERFLSYRNEASYTIKKTGMLSHPGFSRVREKIRTPDLLIRSQTLYPAELRAHFSCSGLRVPHNKNYSTFFSSNCQHFFSKT